MKYSCPSVCPICSGEIKIKEVQCTSCHTKIQGEFQQDFFALLDAEERKFITVFIGSRGNIKLVEKELSISYPTVRSKLDGIIKKLGLD